MRNKRHCINRPCVACEQAGVPIARALRLFADSANFPILVHCVIGKDRTGLVMMLLLLLCGVDEQARLACSQGSQPPVQPLPLCWSSLAMATLLRPAMPVAGPAKRSQVLLVSFVPLYSLGVSNCPAPVLADEGACKQWLPLVQAVVSDYLQSERHLRTSRSKGELSTLQGAAAVPG